MYTSFSISDTEIEHGHYQSTKSCPIALALKEILPDGTYISVVELSTTIDEEQYSPRDPNKSYYSEKWYTHTKEVQDWIKNFDRCRTLVKPVELILDNSNHLIWTKEEHDEHWNRAD